MSNFYSNSPNEPLIFIKDIAKGQNKRFLSHRDLTNC